MTRRSSIFVLSFALLTAAPAVPAMTDAEKDAMISQEARDYVNYDDAAAGDPSRFASPCVPLPVGRMPHGEDPGANDGWELVDFCVPSPDPAVANPADPPDCQHNDDDSALVNLGFSFDLYGDVFTGAFVNNNGNLSFGQRFATFTASGFPIAGFPMVAPFWSDVDTGNPGEEQLGHVWVKQIGSNTLAVTWDQVGYFNRQSDKLNTYQVLISDGTNPDLGPGNNVCFCYDDMQWTTGQASGGVGGFGGTPATVGANRGDGEDFFLIGRFDHEGTDYDGPGGSNDGVDYLDGQGAGVAEAICFNASSQNVPPVAQNFPPNDTIVTECNVSFDVTVEFSSPEGGQTTTVVVDDPDGAQERGLVVTTASGNPATVDLSWEPTPDDQGVYVLTLTATDDFSPPGETVREITIDAGCLEATPLPNVSEELSGVGADARTGSSVSPAGDLDGDGLMDFIAGAPGFQGSAACGPAPVEAGAAAVYLGSTDPAERAQPDIVFIGTAANDRIGVAVAGDFDFDGNGVPDLMIGGEQVDRTDPDPSNHVPTGAGKAYLIYFDPNDTDHYPSLNGLGTAPDCVELSEVGTGLPGEIPGVVFEGLATGDQAGFAVAGGGSVAASSAPTGKPDIAIGAPGQDPDGRANAGLAYLIFNQPLSGVVSLGQVACSADLSCGANPEIAGIRYRGGAAGDAAGFSVAFPGDVVVPAGEEDFAYGAPKADTTPIGVDAPAARQDAGLATISTGGSLVTGIIETDDIGGGPTDNPVDGVRILGDQAFAQFGYSIAGGGDNLRNGEADVLIGAPFYDFDDGLDAVRLEAGLTAHSAAMLQVGIIETDDIGGGPSAGDAGNPVEGARYVGATAGDQLGTSVAGLGDVTGNGSDDIAMGAPFYDPDPSLPDAGVVYVVEGTEDPGTDFGSFNLGIIETDDIGGGPVSGRALTGTQPFQEAGTSVAATGDVDGDGTNDFAVGSPGAADDDGTVSLVDEGNDIPQTPPNSAPIADAGATGTTAECLNENLTGNVTLDGSASSDPDSTPNSDDDIVQYEWFDNGVSIAVTSQPQLLLPLGLGSHPITLTVTDSFGETDATVVPIMVTVEDNGLPSVDIGGPTAGLCFKSPEAVPVIVTASGSDQCDPAPLVTYDCADGVGGPCPDPAPGPEPSYSGHGDYQITVKAKDVAGNVGSDTVGFTIDGVLPTVTIASPPNQVLLPAALPLDVAFDSDDNDGATGVIVHEVIKLDGCPIYDGDTYGDMDGILDDPDDPPIVLGEGELCRIAEECDFTSLMAPQLTIEATDSCGLTGSASIGFGGGIALAPGVCSSIGITLSSPLSTTAEWAGQEGAQDYDVIRGDLRSVALSGDVVDLGSVACVESSSSDTSTAGDEDTDLPEPGEAFFFLVQSYDGQIESGWGRDSSGRDRIVQEGNGGCF